MLHCGCSTTPHPSAVSVCIVVQPDQAPLELPRPQGCDLAAQRTARTSAGCVQWIGADLAQDGSGFVHRRDDQHHLLAAVLPQVLAQVYAAYLPTAGFRRIAQRAVDDNRANLLGDVR